jgi:acetyltransferase-like isoleucine patch superfamily enzyme
MKIKKLLYFVRNVSLIKTFRFNFKYFPMRIAIQVPVFVSKKTKLSKLKGKVNIVSEKLTIGMIQLGLGYVPVFDKRYSRTVWNNSGLVIFKGNAILGHGSKIGCGGILTFGYNFTISAESIIICDNEVTFGNNVLLSWQIQIMDTDFHKVYYEDKLKNQLAKVVIGNNSWIGSRVIINKGVILAENIVVAAGSVVTKSFYEPNTIIGGLPAKIIRTNIIWEK